jgi:cyanophycin synthetase
LNIVVQKVVEGIFFRVERGTWMGHVIDIFLEIQTLAGMDTGFGRTRETKTLGTYNVVFSYTENWSFRRRISRCIAESLIAGTEYDLESDLQKMREIRERVRLGPSTGSIVEEAVSRNIPWIRLRTNSLVQLDMG